MTNARTKYNALKVVAVAWYLSIFLLMTTFLIALYLPLDLKGVVLTIGGVIGGIGPLSCVLAYTIAMTLRAKKENKDG